MSSNLPPEQVTTLASTIDRIEKSLRELTLRVGTLSDSFSTLERKFDGLNASFTALEPKFNGLNASFTALAPKFDGLDASFTALAPKFDGINATVHVLKAQVEGVRSHLSLGDGAESDSASAATGRVVLARVVIYRGKDLLTPPRTKVVLVDSSKGYPPTPVVKCQFMYCEVALLLSGPNEEALRQMVAECVQGGAVVAIVSGIIAGYASGGAAAIPAAVATFTDAVTHCMKMKLSRELSLATELENSCGWGDWE